MRAFPIAAAALVIGAFVIGFRATGEEPPAVVEARSFCAENIISKYPFSPEASEDVSIQDFNAMFAPGGMMDQYAEAKGAQAGAAAAQSKAIQRAFYPDGGSRPRVAFEISPYKLHAAIEAAVLTMDGQANLVRPRGNVAMTMQWPLRDWDATTSGVRLSFLPNLDGRVGDAQFPGRWGFLRFIKASAPEVDGTDLIVTHEMGGRHISYRLKFSGSEIPFLIEELQVFTCPS